MVEKMSVILLLLMAPEVPFPNEATLAREIADKSCYMISSTVGVANCNFLRIDAELNRQWKATQDSMLVVAANGADPTRFSEQFYTAHRQWKKFRAYQCASESYLLGDGEKGKWSFTKTECMIRLTNERTKQLSFLQSQYEIK
jgi:uncharacterized protein YecT (DUF1311 family)